MLGPLFNENKLDRIDDTNTIFLGILFSMGKMKRRILIVDEDQGSLRILTEILTSNGYDVKTVSDGETAISCLDDHCDLLILEINLPGINGIEVCKHAAKISSATKAIFLTAYPSVQTAIDAIHLKANDYICKPVSTEVILSSVKKAFEESIIKKIVENDVLKVQATAGYQTSSEFPDPGMFLPESPNHLHEVTGFSDGISIDLYRRVIKHKGKLTKLTPAENRLLRVFLENTGTIIGHRSLVRMTQGYDTTDVEAPFVLRPLISRLKHKLDCVAGLNLKITNIRGTGYIVECDGKTNN